MQAPTPFEFSEVLPAFLTALAAGSALVLTKQLHGRYTLDSQAGVQKFHHNPTPRIGGVALYLGALAGCLFAPHGLCLLLLGVLVAGLPALLVGLWEDISKRVSVGGFRWA